MNRIGLCFFLFFAGFLFFFLNPAFPLSKGNQRISLFIQELGDKNWKTRDLATKSLIAIGTPSLPFIQKALQREQNLEVLWRLRYCLQEIHLQQAPHYALAKWLLQKLKTERSPTDSPYFQDLVWLGKKKLTPIESLLINPRETLENKILLLKILKIIGSSKSFSFCRKLLIQSNLDFSYDLLDIMFALNSKETGTILLNFLNSSNIKLQIKATYLLTLYPNFQNSLLKNILLKKSYSKVKLVKIYSLRCLGRFFDPKVFARLSMALKDPSYSIRRTALFSLTLHPFLENKPLFIKLLQHRNPFFIQKAIQSLIRIQSRDSLERIRPFLHHSSSNLRQVAIEAIGKLQDKKSFFLLLPFLKGKKMALKLETLQALGNLKDVRSLPYLLKFTQHKHPLLRYTALKSLGNYSQKKSLKALIVALDDPHPLVQKGAIQSLRKLTHLQFGYAIRSNKQIKEKVKNKWKQWSKENLSNQHKKGNF